MMYGYVDGIISRNFYKMIKIKVGFQSFPQHNCVSVFSCEI